MVDSGSRPARAAREFFAPVPLAAVALLAANDHFLKAWWPGFVTGKLSDISGCFFLPLFLSAFLALGTRWSLRLRLALGASVTVAFFSAIKLSPAAAAGVAAAVTTLGSHVGLPGSRIVADAMDLTALPFAAVAVWYGVTVGERPEVRTRLAPAGRLAVLAATVVVLTATAASRKCPPDPGLVDVMLRVDTNCGTPGYVVLRAERGTCRASLEGAEAVGFPDRGDWQPDGSLRLVQEAAPGLVVPEGQVPLTSCTLKPEGADLLRVDCRSVSLENPSSGPFHVLRDCSGTMRRRVEAAPASSGPPRP